MDTRFKTSSDRDGLVIENAAQSLSDEEVGVLATRSRAHLEMLEIGHERDLTPEMRQRSAELRWRVSRGWGETGSDSEVLKAELRDVAIERGDQISTILQDRIRRRAELWPGVKWSDQVVEAPVDHSFWWARTQAHVTPGMGWAFRDDGLHFWGGPKVNDYDGEMHTSFGAVASFALQPERFPTSPSGRFLSSPHVELFGGVVAHAPDEDLIQGNGIAECRLFLRQTLFQWGLGPSGPAPVMIGEAKDNDDWRIYLKNTGYSQHAALPGFKLIPAVVYNGNQVAPSQLWAEIEVRLDIYLNCTGALVWCDPAVLLRTFQWAPTPLP
jgi:hypothetical protein